MRILRVHNRYQQRGGEDVSFDSECSLLEQMGEDVRRLEFSNVDIPAQPSVLDAVKLAGNTIWSLSSRRRIAETVDAFRPDIVHFDNTFPLISPAAYGVVKRRGIPVVQSLRNFRLLCPSAVLFHRGAIYEDNVGKLIPWRAVRDKVYHDSYTQTAAVASMLAFHRLTGAWRNNVDRYVALTDFVKNMHTNAGMRPERIAVKPNFVFSPPSVGSQYRRGFLYVGRLSGEKGVSTLLHGWALADGTQLTVIGDGDERLVEQITAREVTYRGRMAESSTHDAMASATALIVPSECYETFGRVVIEAFAVSTPVIASRLGGLAEIVEDGVTGLHFEPGNSEDLAVKMNWAAEHPQEMRRMGRNARREYESRYTPERNYRMLMDIYAEAIEENNRLA